MRLKPGVLMVVLLAVALAGEMPPQPCPIECLCYYHRVHWVAECSHRGLTQTPTGLAPATYTLDLSGNVLTDFSVASQPKLRRILLTNNNVASLDDRSFKGLSYLIDVDVSGNRLRSIDAHTFVDSAGLITFEARRNKEFEGPQSGQPLLESRTLQTIDLADCGIKVVGANWFGKSPALRKIILSGNPIQAIEKGAFVFLHSLEELHLSRTKVQGIVASDFAPDPPLRTLHLSHTPLEGNVLKLLLAGLPHLERLDVRESQLTLDAGHVDVFGRCQWLRWLDVAGNDLSGWDAAAGLAPLRQLEHLDLSNCRVALASHATSSVPRLRVLDLSGNSLALANVTELLRPLHKLQALRLRDCQLRTTDWLRHLPKVRESLRALDLSANPLGDAQVNAAGSVFTRLEALNVSHCALATITREAFSPARSLRSLAFSGNPNLRIQDGALAALEQLERLEADDCGLRSAPSAQVFAPEPKLTELRLAGNPLKQDLIPSHLSNLQVLDVSRCGLRNVSAAALAGAGNLQRLVAQGNAFTDSDFLPTELARVAPKLELLDLRGSQVRHVAADTLSECKALRLVYLEENPLECDCEMKRTWRWAKWRGVALHERRGGTKLRCHKHQQPWPKPLEALQCSVRAQWTQEKGLVIIRKQKK